MLGDKVKGNSFDIQEPGLSAPVHLEAFSLLDSDPGPQALIKLSASVLGSYSKVSLREDMGPKDGKAGCSISSVWRRGTDSSGDLVTYEAMGAAGGYYFLLTFHRPDLVHYKADRKLIDALLPQIGIEPGP